MTGNLLLVVGPLIGLAILRIFGRWRPLPAFAAAAVCQLVVFCGYALWQQYRRTHPGVRSSAGVSGVAHITPTLSGRLTAVAALLVIAAMVAALMLWLQAVAARGSSGPPPAV